MASGRLGAKWSQTALILQLLEGCQQVEIQWNPSKWIPDEFRDDKPTATPAEAKQEKRDMTEDEKRAHIERVRAFNAVLMQGRES